MIIHKVFNISSKAIEQKPVYVKPKYKTYRQLLELDKPKMIIDNYSDDQNDDFLQKLMRKQQKLQEQQKKKRLKQKKITLGSSSANSKKSNKNNHNEIQPNKKQLEFQQSIKNSKQQAQNNLIDDDQDQQQQQLAQQSQQQSLDINRRNSIKNESMKTNQQQKRLSIIEQGNNSIKSKMSQYQVSNDKQNISVIRNTPTITQHNLKPILKLQQQLLQHSQQQHNLSKNAIKVKKRHRSQSTMNLWQKLQLNSLSKTSSYKKRNQLINDYYSSGVNVIKMSVIDGNQERQVVRNQFGVSLTGRKSQGYKVLRQQLAHIRRGLSLHDLKNTTITKLQTKLNPQLRQINHQLSTAKYKPSPSFYSSSSNPTQYLLKSAISAPVQQLLMKKIIPSHIKSKRPRQIKQRLFRSKYQQQLFIKSLKNSHNY